MRNGTDYFHVDCSFVHPYGDPNWTLEVRSWPDAGMRPARFLGSGSIDRFTLHDALKVVDCQIEIALMRRIGIQTTLDSVR